MKRSVTREWGMASRVAVATMLSVCCLATTSVAATTEDDDVEATSFPQVERKVKNLRKRVRQLEADVAALQTQHLPVEAQVDCGSGGSVSDALAANAEGKGSLTIVVSGACAEAIRISRSDVTLRGASAGAALQGTSTSVFTVIVEGGASNVELQNLTISGSNTAALVATKGAHVIARNVTVQQSISGAMALDNGTLDVVGSTVRNNSQGAYAARGGVVTISGGTVESNQIGALAWKAGTVIFTSSLPELGAPGGAGPVVQANFNGVVARSGGFVEFADTTVQNNTQNGVVVDSGGTAHFFSALTGAGNRIAGNPANGIVASRNTSLVFSDLTNVITGNGRGIVCNGNPSYIVPPGFVVAGNTLGDILGCAP
ncbi:hypothetical protein HNQ60_004265 [Povalibacter uvarum]|uniref:Right handed beta helix domain-containing protein n=1 Tax=Povalibacter uvarum TaxID=732238 RepID=A0A841HU54_9GAMM|nr:right-handed parallel beta-helix repeat-containing protein [Povalibacter uvarum]MBB6095375.1 hypothetical protein [Povalibacter uvarum]